MQAEDKLAQWYRENYFQYRTTLRIVYSPQAWKRFWLKKTSQIILFFFFSSSTMSIYSQYNKAKRINIWTRKSYLRNHFQDEGEARHEKKVKVFKTTVFN